MIPRVLGVNQPAGESVQQRRAELLRRTPWLRPRRFRVPVPSPAVTRLALVFAILTSTEDERFAIANLRDSEPGTELWRTRAEFACRRAIVTATLREFAAGVRGEWVEDQTP